MIPPRLACQFSTRLEYDRISPAQAGNPLQRFSLPVVSNFEQEGGHQHDCPDHNGDRQRHMPVSESHVRIRPVNRPGDHHGENSQQQRHSKRQQSQQQRNEECARRHGVPARLRNGIGGTHNPLDYIVLTVSAGALSAVRYNADYVAGRSSVDADSRGSRSPDSCLAGVERRLLCALRRGHDFRRRPRAHDAAVPRNAAAALERKAYYFVPLTVSQGDDTVIADRYDVVLSDNAVCHRNLNLGDAQCVFISTRLMDDKFSVAFEFYINVGHAIVERIGVSQAFADLAWKQVEAEVRGETSMDAWEARKAATGSGPDTEKYKNEFFARRFLGCDLDLPAVAVSRRGLLRSARARLPAAGALRDGRTPEKSRGTVPAQPRVRVRHLPQARASSYKAPSFSCGSCFGRSRLPGRNFLAKAPKICNRKSAICNLQSSIHARNRPFLRQNQSRPAHRRMPGGRIP